MSKPKLEKNGLLIPTALIKELLTDSELRMVKQRFVIMNLIATGLSIRAIAKKVGVGTDTVVRISRKIESNPQLKDFLQKPKQSGQEGVSSKWVFGQVSSEEIQH